MKLALFGCFHGWPQQCKQPPHGQEISETWSNLPACKELHLQRQPASPSLTGHLERNHTACEVSGSCPRHLMHCTRSESHEQACARSSTHTAGCLSSNAESQADPLRAAAAPGVGKGPAMPDHHVTTVLRALALAGDGLPVVTAKVILQVSIKGDQFSTGYRTNAVCHPS